MRIKELFTVPTGTNITESMFTKVLLSSVCSILLCMACLAGTTWAWFTVSMENTENVIQIAAVEKTVTVKKSDLAVNPTDAVYPLSAGQYTVQVTVSNTASKSDDLNRQRSPAYVLMSVKQSDGENSEVTYYCFCIDGAQGTAELALEICGEPVELSFSVTWVKPASASVIDGSTLAIGQNEP